MRKRRRLHERRRYDGAGSESSGEEVSGGGLQAGWCKKDWVVCLVVLVLACGVRLIYLWESSDNPTF